MSRALSLCGVILAAGDSLRMGTDKALLPWPPSAEGAGTAGTFLSAAIESLSLPTDLVIVVAGKNASSIAPTVYATGASLVINPAPERGQFSSLQVGLREVLRHGRDAALITLVDRPPASTATVQTLREAFESAKNEIWAVVPEFSNKHGHPFIAGREMIEAFLQAPATSMARDIEHKHQAHIQYVTVNDPFIALNINTPDDYAKLSTLSVERS